MLGKGITATDFGAQNGHRHLTHGMTRSSQWLPRYVQWVMETGWHDLHELQGKTLVCDSQHGGPCEADMLAGMVFDSLRPADPPLLRKAVVTPRAAKPQRRVSLVGRVSAGLAIPERAWSFPRRRWCSASASSTPMNSLQGSSFLWLKTLSARTSLRPTSNGGMNKSCSGTPHWVHLKPFDKFDCVNVWQMASRWVHLVTKQHCHLSCRMVYPWMSILSSPSR